MNSNTNNGVVNIIGGYATQTYEWLFGKEQTFEEMLADIKFKLDDSQRDMNAEIIKAQVQIEMKYKDIERKARDRNTTRRDLYPMIKNVFRLQSQKTKFEEMKGKIEDFKMTLMDVKTTATLTQSYAQLTRSLVLMSKQCNLGNLAQVMFTNDVEMEKLKIVQEKIDESIENMYDEDQEELDADELCSQILSKMNIELEEDLSLTTGKVKNKKKPELVFSEEDKELFKKVEQL